MPTEAELNIAEIPYASGRPKFRYSRFLAPDGTRWVRHGLFVAYHENGVVSSEGSYVQGVEHGLWREFHENGQPASEGSYQHGEEVGTWRFWGADGVEQPSVGRER
ncbi:toxin-antitoxin system YwqK family antitoxin [Comamonas sp. MYb396]|uniref:toxin-antitoxin system YwqK family antitoxin n=1 Tax=Comamonas sp. MYb396 TaxID=2745302 RepID=UPI0030B1F42D